MENSSRNWAIILILIVFVLAISGIAYFVFGKSSSIVSPVPAEPSFKVIYYTPTPGPITPSSTPSATPKVKATSAPVPTTKVSPTVTPKVTVTPTP